MGKGNDRDYVRFYLSKSIKDWKPGMIPIVVRLTLPCRSIIDRFFLFLFQIDIVRGTPQLTTQI